MPDLEHIPLDSHTRQFLQQAESSPFDFHSLSIKAAGDERLKTAINSAVMRQYTGRQLRLLELPDAQALRVLAGQIREHVLDHLDSYLQQLVASVRRNGGQVHFATDARHAREIIIDIARRTGSRLIVKSKSMVSEEVGLDRALEEAGLEPVETDLGEFIVQLSKDRPSHIVAPIVHKDRASIARLFSETFKTPYDDNPESLTMQARAHLREKFRRADMGMTGANFLIAETGQVCVVENEGNARQSLTTPRILVTLAGIEKIIPRMIDLSVFIKLLARSATGQSMTVYTSIFGLPRRTGEIDGPEEFHLVLLDNGRTDILAGQYREILRCIRCGACLNACPVYRKIGGHAYGQVYSGPIGALLTPLTHGLREYKDLPQASSLCGACFEACPVRIDIPKHLVQIRREIVSSSISGRIERLTYRFWAWGMKTPLRYRFMSWFQRKWLRRRSDNSGWISDLPGLAGGWTKARDLPAPAPRSFRQLWKSRAGMNHEA